MKLFLIICFSIIGFAQSVIPTRIGSKIFTEGYILAEILAVQLEKNNFQVERMSGLGATGVTEEAMKSKQIDLIVDYTGSIAKAFLNKEKPMTVSEIREGLKPLGFTISDPLGFNNTYALAVRADWAAEHNIKTFSDLKKLTNVKAAFTPEFTSRPENWPGLMKKYSLKNFEIKELDHQLAYEAVRLGEVEVVEAYSTDAKLKEFKLLSLEDDLKYFPNYDAVIMTHLEWLKTHPKEWQSVQELVGKIPEKIMIDLNSQADLEKKDFNDIAKTFLNVKSNEPLLPKWIKDVKESTLEHLILVLIPVFFAFIVGVPLAYAAYRFPRFHPLIGASASIFQTIPALAFLTFLIPFVGIGTIPALIVLFLYALLPIFVSSHQGFSGIPELSKLSCKTLDLKGFFKFKKIELPMALPSILAGFQTSLITTVASATLAALIGAGGYGKKIIAGLAVNDTRVVLLGAIPAAVMALLFQYACQFISKRVQKTIR